MSLPDHVALLFHNYLAERIDPDRSPDLVVLTVLKDGNMDDIRWAFGRFGRAEVERIVRNDLEGLQTLPYTVANLWSVVFWDHPLPARTTHDRWKPTRTFKDHGDPF